MSGTNSPFLCLKRERKSFSYEESRDQHVPKIEHYLNRLFPFIVLVSMIYFIFKHNTKKIHYFSTVEPRFNEVAGDRPNLFVKWKVRYIENLDITNLRENDQNVRYIEAIVND